MLRADGTGSPEQITVVIAAKDEGATVEDVVRRCLAVAGRVIVVDGDSRDQTVAAASRAGATVLVQQGRPGKGTAMREAIPHVTTPITVFIDADGSHVPEDIPLIARPILDGHADHVSASRLLGGSSELHGGFDEFFRLTGSSFITACINWRFRVRLSDSQNGFRAIRTEVLQRLDLRANSTTIEQEMIIRSLRAGARMTEVPSHEHGRQFGTSHIRIWRAAPKYVFSLVRHLLY
jgi:dolichol-phosphate mannosyltransferase